jgi:hypothetical protein
MLSLLFFRHLKELLSEEVVIRLLSRTNRKSLPIDLIDAEEERLP